MDGRQAEIGRIVAAQRAYFGTGATKPAEFRLAALQKLREGLLRREKPLCGALRADLGKSAFESYMTELGMVLDELRFEAAHLRSWAKPRAVRTPLAQFRAKSFVCPEPYGVALIMAPWNYPVQLSLEPLIGALAAGNCAVLKPSAYAPRVSRELEELLAECFPPEYVAVVQGGREENAGLLAQRFDFIFFTGSVAVGKLVMKAAAEHLTPVSLELGGKSPCIVDSTADLRLAARRIVFGKFLNAGQTCVAPDYLLVQSDVQGELTRLLGEEIRAQLGAAPLENAEYPRIVNEKHFRRLLGLMEGAQVLAGGEAREGTLQIAPTLLSGVTGDSPVMREEIFGPLLPLLPFGTLDEAVSFVAGREKPLALYLFTGSRAAERRVLRELSFGGGCVNDTVIHLATPHMGFGGVGNSGMGSYHGKKSFDTFSHEKSIVRKAAWIDLPMRYHPYTEAHFRLLRRFLH